MIAHRSHSRHPNADPVRHHIQLFTNPDEPVLDIARRHQSKIRRPTRLTGENGIRFINNEHRRSRPPALDSEDGHVFI